MPNSPNLGLLMMAASQAQKETVFNNFLIAMDALYKGSVVDVTLNTPPGSPNLGDAYIIAIGGTGAWSGNDEKVAVYFNGWQFFGASNGMILYSTAQGNYYVYKTGAGWQATPTIAVTDLTDLTDVTAGGASDKQVLAYQASDSKWGPLTLSLTLMSDVNVTEGSGIDGWVLAYKNSDTRWEAKQLATVAFSGAYSDLAGAPAVPTNDSFNLASLGDVKITSLTNGQGIVWNAADSKWENGAASGGGGAVAVQNNGSAVTAAASILNFVNASSITNSGGSVTITLPTGGVGGAGTGGGTGTGNPLYELGAFAPPEPSWFSTASEPSGVTTTLSSIANRGMTLDAQGATATQLALATRPCTSWGSSWAVTMRARMYESEAQYPEFGLCVIDSSGKIANIVVEGVSTTGLYVYQERWTNHSTFGSNNKSSAISQTPTWFRLRFDGTSLYYGFSMDGVGWSEYREVATSYLGALVSVGICWRPQTSSANFPQGTPNGGLVTYWDDPDYPASSHTISSGGGSGGSGSGFPFFSPPDAAWLDTSASATTTTLTSVAAVGTVVRAAVNTSSEILDFARVPVSGWSTPWKVTARLKLSADMFNSWAGFGLNLMDSAGRLVGVEIRPMSSGALVYVSAEQWNSVTSHYGNATSDQLEGGIPEWFQIGYDGTNITLSYSYDGQSWSTYTQAATAFLTGAPAYVGIGIHNYFNATRNFSASNVSVTCTYWDDPAHPATNQNGGLGGTAGAPPTVVQSTAFVGAGGPFLMESAPAPGNLLVALVSHWSSGDTLGAGWNSIINVTGSNDYEAIAFKVATASDTASLIPYNAVSGASVTIFEVAGAAFVQPSLYAVFHDNNAATQTIEVYAPNNSLVLGHFTTTSNEGLPTGLAGVTAGPTAQVASGSGSGYGRSAAGFYASVAMAGTITATATYPASEDANGAIIAIQGIGTV